MQITKEIKEKYSNEHTFLPKNARAQHLNKDALKDLVYNNKVKYQQTPEGNFIKYTKEKADSLNKMYQNKLKKRSKKIINFP